MALPVRFTVCTYNIWTDTRWPERAESLRGFTQFHLPDIYCLQELQADSKRVLDEVLLPTHQRVEDDFKGWTVEGNIYWNTQLFELVEYGAEQVGIYEEFRRLFWVRLKLNDDSGKTIFVSTAHWTYPGHPIEAKDNKNARFIQAQNTVEALNRLGRADEPMLFMGDLNDSSRPIEYLRANGFTDCFRAMGRETRFTHPAIPTAGGVPVGIDWMFHRGAIRPMNCEVVDFYLGDLAPSDHKPVLATYTFI
jgi:endonuclease/exonuclease/phosphatase family metal-dependent hydrolase